MMGGGGGGQNWTGRVLQQVEGGRSGLKGDGVLVQWAAREGALRLRGVGSRWEHCQGVGRRALAIARLLETVEDRESLVAAAFLHDVGHAPELRRSGFHPLDGGRYLRSLGYERLAGLVAHHCEARFEAEILGLTNALGEFPREVSATADALTYCDLTTGPAGETVTFEARCAEVRKRYARNQVILEGLRRSTPYLARAVARTVARMQREGVA